MKPILLVHPSREVGGLFYPPLGLLYVAAALEEKGHRVVVTTEAKKGFNVVGVTALSTYRHWAIDQLHRAKKFGAHTVLGGAHTQGLGKYILDRYEWIDSVVEGHGELCLGAFSKDGLFKNHSAYVPDFWPSRHLIDLEPYIKAKSKFNGGRRETQVMCGRGCIGNCCFCATPSRFPHLKVREQHDILNEISFLHDYYDIDAIQFCDDTFNWSTKWAMDFCQELEDNGPNGMIYTGLARADKLTPELATAMKNTGWRSISVGIETGSERIFSTMGKRETLEDVEAGVRAAHDAGIIVAGMFIFGWPGETKDDCKATIRLAKRLPLNQVAASPAIILYPGSKLLTESRLPPEIWDDWIDSPGAADMGGMNVPGWPGANDKLAKWAWRKTIRSRVAGHPFMWYNGLRGIGYGRIQSIKDMGATLLGTVKA